MNADLRIEAVTKADLPGLRTLQPKGWGDIIPNLIYYLESDFCYVIKVLANGEIVACGTAIVHDNATWLANIITHEKHRGKGLGTLVTKHLTDYALTKSPSVILIATDLGLPVYIRLGYIKGEEYTVFKPRPYTGTIDAEVIPYEARFEREVLAIDYETTGELRSRIIKPRLNEAFVYMSNGCIQGFTIPELGEGVTFAQTPEAGIALMKKTLQLGKRIVIPLSNKPALDFLYSQGYEKDNWYGVKMHFGQAIDWKPQQTFGRIGGNLG
jgi:GNAT superfamily N-acetyltransferase